MPICSLFEDWESISRLAGTSWACRGRKFERRRFQELPERERRWERQGDALAARSRRCQQRMGPDRLERSAPDSAATGWPCCRYHESAVAGVEVGGKRRQGMVELGINWDV